MRKEAKLLVPYRPYPGSPRNMNRFNGSVLGGVPWDIMGSKLFAFSCAVSSHVTGEIDCGRLIKCCNFPSSCIEDSGKLFDFCN